MNNNFISWLPGRLLRAIARPLFTNQWIIAFRKHDGLSSLPNRTDHFTTIRASGGENYADPFVISKNGTDYVFFERWSESRPKGVICYAPLASKHSGSEPAVALERPYHLSYPFLFQWNGDTFMLPETCQRRAVELYVAVDFPHKWELATVLMSNVCAADPTLLHYKGKFWLFVGGPGDAKSRVTALSVFFSESMLGPWQRHPKNPVVTDIRSARPAGALFFQAGQLIRPAQNCWWCYGHAISLKRIDVLTEDDYREQYLATISPNWMPWLGATHTFNHDNDLQVLDGWRLVWRTRRCFPR